MLCRRLPMADIDSRPQNTLHPRGRYFVAFEEGEAWVHRE
jgi:hypothetical protein